MHSTNIKGEQLRKHALRYHPLDQEDLAGAMDKLVRTFSRIIDSPLCLYDKGPPSTDGFIINVSFKEDTSYTMCEHLIAHILFKTDYAAKIKFETEYASQIASARPSLATAAWHKRIQAFVGQVVDVLDDHRVSNAWGRIYAGSKIKYDDIKYSILDNSTKLYDPNDVVVYMIGVSVGHTNSYSNFHKHEKVVKEALHKVEGVPFPTVFVVARWLIVKLIDSIVKEQHKCSGDKSNIIDSLEDREKILKNLASKAPAIKASSDFLREVTGKGGTADPEADTSLNVPLENIEDHLQESREFFEEGLNKTIEALSFVTQGVEAPYSYSVRFHDVAEHRATLDHSREFLDSLSGKPKFESRGEFIEFLHHKGRIDHASRDNSAAARLRQVAYQILGRTRTGADDAGIGVDVPSLIERRVTNYPIPCLTSERPVRGFDLLVLADQSKSMLGDKLVQVERACRILMKATAFPFVRFNVWGFTGLDNNQVDLFRYTMKDSSFSMANAQCAGTPLHLAIDASASWFAGRTGARHLIVLTDGEPTMADDDGNVVNTEDLVIQTRYKVNLIRRSGISVHGLFIDEQDATGVPKKNVDNEILDFMFGSRLNWERTFEPQLANSIVKLVSAMFIRHLSL